MKDPKTFCTCTYLDCESHPANHDQGCDLCMAKNLKTKEIPECMFHLLGKDDQRKGYDYAEFARLVQMK